MMETFNNQIHCYLIVIWLIEFTKLEIFYSEDSRALHFCLRNYVSSKEIQRTWIHWQLFLLFFNDHVKSQCEIKKHSSAPFFENFHLFDTTQVERKRKRIFR